MTSKLVKGTLIVTKKGCVTVTYPTKKGEMRPRSVAQAELSVSLSASTKSWHGEEVEFETAGGQPKRVREPGGTFQAMTNTTQGDRAKKGKPGYFRNPYNFVPAPPRDTTHAELGDHAPVAQDFFDPTRYTGHIRVQMVAKTPILVPDSESVHEYDAHKTYELRCDAAGKPAIAPSSVRGMLRTAYEAVTNSRFSQFSGEHRNRLAFRMAPADSLNLIPARIEKGKIVLLAGSSQIVSGKLRRGAPQYAAWLPRYERDGNTGRRTQRYPASRSSELTLPTHGDRVMCRLNKFSKRNFEYWCVTELARADHQPLSKSTRPDEIIVLGWVYISNANIGNKHDERVFFSDGQNTPGPFPVNDQHRSSWQELINSYRSLHDNELQNRENEKIPPDKYLGDKPGETAWSRHLYDDSCDVPV